MARLPAGAIGSGCGKPPHSSRALLYQRDASSKSMAVGILIGMLLTGEAPDLFQFAGLALVMAGLLQLFTPCGGAARFKLR